MISSLPLTALTSPVGIALIKRLFPNLLESDINLILELVKNYGSKEATIGEVLNDPIVASVIEGKSGGQAKIGLTIADYKNALVECPNCLYIDKLRKFAPKLFEE